jgi:hypothetical protein
MRSAVVLALAVVLMGCSVEATENPATSRASDPNRIGGKVLETIDASGYTYIRFETPDGEAWAAVPRAQIETGSDVVIANPQVMADFASQALGRTFETIYFGTLGGQPAPITTARSGADPHGSTPGQMVKPAHAGDAGSAAINVEKAGGPTGRTIAELYAQKGELSGKSVALRGKVVKYSAGIMGRNWIHLQDGSGDAAAGTHDITVTSSATASVGDVILIEGTVVLDKDFGSGYRYAVIVEEASLK